jgi:hypothetical protein
MSKLLKRTVVRLLLFGIPFSLAYWATRPAPQKPGGQFFVCAYPGDLPGELRIDLDPAVCAETVQPMSEAPVAVYPAIGIPQPPQSPTTGQSINIPF